MAAAAVVTEVQETRQGMAELRMRQLAGLALLLLAGPLCAGVLPEDRADALYHAYSGGGVTVDGPSLLVRKQFGLNTSLYANYYTDSVSSASIDVIALGASKYSEQRKQTTIGGDYLHGNVTMSAAYTNSSENDYEANSASFSISQDLFGDMTTVTLAYTRGWDTVMRNGDPTFSEDVTRQQFQVGVSQIMSKDLIMGFTLETITDEGYLNNPYRAVRYLDPASSTGFSFQTEVYPNTRTSTAFAVNAKYYLPYRAALSGLYRLFVDDWGIQAHTLEIGYTHPWKKWTFEGKYRFYTQTHADFYSDLFPFQNAQNFMARDKELSSFKSHTLGVGASYDFTRPGWHFIDKGTLNAAWDLVHFSYDDFRDIPAGGTPGSEPLYSFNANVIRLFLSVWY